MKHIFLLSALIGIVLVMGSCSNDDNPLGNVTYYGVVNNANTGEPFPNVTISVTNGYEIRVSTKTNSSGNFSISVNISELSSSFYILVGDDYTDSKRFELTGISKNEVDLGVINLKPASEPKLSNLNVKSDGDNIVFDVNIITNNISTLKEVGICYGLNSNPTVDDNIIVGLLTESSVSAKINKLDLNAGSNYYFRAYAINNIGIGYSNSTMFRTEDATPELLWNTNYWGRYYDEITPESIIGLSAYVRYDGGYDITEYGFCYSDSNPTPTIQDAKSIGSLDQYDDFVTSIFGLNPSTKYYVRPYAINTRNGIGYGTILQFETLSGLAEITLTTSWGRYDKYIKANAYIRDTGGGNISQSGICYSTNPNPSINDNKIYINKTSKGEFVIQIPITTFDLTYYIKAFAITQYGVSYSVERQEYVSSEYLSE